MTKFVHRFKSNHAAVPTFAMATMFCLCFLKLFFYLFINSSILTVHRRALCTDLLNQFVHNDVIGTSREPRGAELTVGHSD